MMRQLAAEGVRYGAAAVVALGADFATYSGLIRLLHVHYLAAAPCGFAVGLALIYALSVRWVFRQRRLKDSRAEFALFAAIGVAGMGLNQFVIYAGVEWAGLGYEPAKLVSAALVFFFNFGARKALLFSHR